MTTQDAPGALRGVLSAKAADGALRVVEGFGLDEIGTRALHRAARPPGRRGARCWWCCRRATTWCERSCRNLREVRVMLADSLNVVDLLDADTVVFTRDALTRAQEVYA